MPVDITPGSGMNRFNNAAAMDAASSNVQLRIFVAGRDSSAWYLDKPVLSDGRLMYPNDARLMNSSYTAALYADILVEYARSGQVLESRSFPRVKIGAIPIMLHSSICVLRDQAPQVLRDMGECAFDQGGYFVVGGKEKVVIAQERVAYNRLFVTRLNPKSTAGKVYSHDAVLRSMSATDLFPKAIRFNVFAKAHAKRSTAIVFTLPHLTGAVPLFVLFRALGVESDEDILRHVVGGAPVDQGRISPEDAQIVDFMRASVVDCAATRIFTQDDAVAELEQRQEQRTNVHGRSEAKVKTLLVEGVLPNAGTDFESKAVYLGFLINRFVRVIIGVNPLTVRDSWVHKRMDLSGYLIADLFRDMYRRFRVDFMRNLLLEYASGPWRNGNDIFNMVNINNVARIFDSSVIENGMIRSFKGAWNFDDKAAEGSNYNRAGVVQDLNRQSYQSYVSHMRRVSTVMGTEVKLVAPHLLLPEQWGAVCPVESPDGPNVGLLKHFSLACHVTCDRDPRELVKHLCNAGIIILLHAAAARTDYINNNNNNNNYKQTRVFVNHGIVGAAHRPEKLVQYVRLLRRTGLVAPDVSVTWDIFGYEIHILTDGGRTCRPLLVAGSAAQLERMRQTEEDHHRLGDFSWKRLISGTLLADDELLPNEFAGGVCADPKLLYAHGAPAAAASVLLDQVLTRLEQHAGPVDLIDTEELKNVLVCSGYPRVYQNPLARTSRYTHYEIHPALMFSPLTATIPLLNHNPSAYNSLCLAQTKQGLGMYACNFRHRMDVAGAVLHSTQLPLVTTYFADKMCQGGKLTHGENLIVAIATWGGYNQDDGLVINAAAVQRGMLNVSVFSTETFREEASSWDGGMTSKSVIANPLQAMVDVDVSGFKSDADYATLGPNGLPMRGAWIQEGRAILGMCFIDNNNNNNINNKNNNNNNNNNNNDNDNNNNNNNNNNDNQQLEEVERGGTPSVSDVSHIADRTVRGRVDRVYLSDGAPGSRTCKVRLLEVREPAMGDKLASRFGQKGVVGMLVPSQDMPFSPDGVVPDVIINPHGFPNRKTVGHILEALLGKAACCVGHRLDATSFDGADPVAAARSFFMSPAAGGRWTTSGDTVLYNGRTGEQLATQVFVGVNYYNRLKHMAVDKINYRATGSLNFLTHQPTQGRGNGGGLKVGEMEQHCILAHGAASFLKESFFDRSDPFHIHIDEASGKRATLAGGGTQLPASVSAVVRAPMPYSFKQVTQEIESMLSIGMNTLV
jgi:DNA-directed RNA polymerase II subunit RPB2